MIALLFKNIRGKPLSYKMSTSPSLVMLITFPIFCSENNPKQCWTKVFNYGLVGQFVDCVESSYLVEPLDL